MTDLASQACAIFIVVFTAFVLFVTIVLLSLAMRREADGSAVRALDTLTVDSIAVVFLYATHIVSPCLGDVVGHFQQIRPIVLVLCFNDGLMMSTDVKFDCPIATTPTKPPIHAR